jgi:hypothetical protein
MATINFSSTITKVDSATLTLNNSTYIGVAIKLSHNDHLINTMTLADYTLPNDYAYAGLIYTGTKNYTITSTTAFSTATFVDGVYRATVDESYDDGNTYVSTAYQLLTYDIDARWAEFQTLYDPTNAANLAIFNNVTQAYADIATLSANLAANYTTINAKISYISGQLSSAVFYFTSQSVLTNATTVTVSTSYYNGGLAIDSSDLDILNLTITQTKSYAALPQLNIAVSGNKSKTFSAGSPIGSPNYTDGVLENTIYCTGDVAWEWQSVSYLLVTTQIDADIAAYPTDSLFNISNKALMLYFRGLVDTAFAAEDYTTCNDYIVAIQNILIVVPNPFTTSLILEENNSLQSVSSILSTTGLIWQYNLLWNTKTQDVENAIVIEDNYLLPDGNGSASFTSEDTFDSAIYEDGVYQLWNYLADITGGVASSNKSNNSGFRTITTTIDAEFLTFQANYDPENAEQAASYQAMLDAYAEIATLSSNISANYAAINAQIAIIQANLALWVELDMSLVLTNKSLMTLTINTTLPNVVYNSQSLNLSNTNDDSQEYIVTTFPNNYIDLTKTFSSSEINFGTQFEDGVYKLNLSWSADNDMEFSGVTYCLVMTQVDCGIAQVVANRPNCKNVRSQLNMLMFFRDMALDAYANEDYTTCNFYINKCIIILNQSGCGCGCN